MIFSEARLKLEPRWFTGQEWADGTAERHLQQEYYEAAKREEFIEKSKTPAQLAKDKATREKKRFQKWFEFKLRQDNGI